MAPRKIIIDTDPGVDDTLAMLLAFSALPEEVEVLLVSVTYGNIHLQGCIRNIISLFHHIEKEIVWRGSQGRPCGFETMVKTKPLVALGAEGPLSDAVLMADYFHGHDGLGNIDKSHEHLSPTETWQQILTEAQRSKGAEAADIAEELGRQKKDRLFIPSQMPAHQEILRLLRENEPDTVTIVAIGPLTNLAMAAAENPETFLRAQEVVIMGGAIEVQGNITPLAEFNAIADSMAAARVYALTSPNPHTTMPPSPPPSADADPTSHSSPHLGAYPSNLSRQLNLTIFPLDITNLHELTRGEFRIAISPLISAGSPLAEWASAFMTSTFNKIDSLVNNVSGDAIGLQLHDPLCIWYCITGTSEPGWKVKQGEDIRVETFGQWTRGMCVVDRRDRTKRDDEDVSEKAGDSGTWLNLKAGNRVQRCVGTPGGDVFAPFLLKRVFGL